MDVWNLIYEYLLNVSHMCNLDGLKFQFSKAWLNVWCCTDFRDTNLSGGLGHKGVSETTWWSKTVPAQLDATMRIEGGSRQGRQGIWTWMSHSQIQVLRMRHWSFCEIKLHCLTPIDFMCHCWPFLRQTLKLCRLNFSHQALLSVVNDGALGTLVLCSYMRHRYPECSYMPLVGHWKWLSNLCTWTGLVLLIITAGVLAFGILLVICNWHPMFGESSAFIHIRFTLWGLMSKWEEVALFSIGDFETKSNISVDSAYWNLRWTSLYIWSRGLCSNRSLLQSLHFMHCAQQC